MRKHFVAGLLVSAAVIGLPAVTEAAPKKGCPAEASGWLELSIDDTVAAIYPDLIDNPFENPDDLKNALQGLNRNGDESLCLLKQWGPERNTNSRWYPTTLFIVVDNNANARK